MNKKNWLVFLLSLTICFILGGVGTSKALAATSVNAENFLDYFTLQGDASYNEQSGVVTLTPDQNDKVGNFTLNDQIDPSASFTLKGQVNLGSKTDVQGGADGIGFAFHPGDKNAIGFTGANLGIGGLANATGFKLDTYYNGYYEGGKGGDANHNLGWEKDPTSGRNQPFGTFVTTDDTTYAHNDVDAVQKLSTSVLDGKFHDFVIAYDGATRKLTITYDNNGTNLVWTKTVDSNYKALSMAISASTGGNKNLQQYKIDSFDYTPTPGNIIVKYVDATLDKDIINPLLSNGEVGTDYTTEQKSFEGYNYVKVESNMDTNYTGTGTYQKDTTVITYYYVKNTSISGEKIWKDYNNKFSTRPDSIVINLLQNGTPIKQQTIKADENGAWKYNFEGLDKYNQAGEAYVYTVSEVSVPSYTSVVTDSKITNTLKVEPVTIAGKKIWDDNNNAYNKRPTSITVSLLQNGQQIKQQIVTADAAGNWMYSFDNLDKYDANGNEYSYTIQEEPVDGYQTIMDSTGFNITNKINVGTPGTSETTTESSTNTSETTTESSTNTSETTTESSTNTSETTTGSSTNTSETTTEPSTSTSETTTEPSTSTSETTTESSTSTSGTTTEPSTSTSETTTESSTDTSGTTTEPSTSTSNSTAEPSTSTSSSQNQIVPNSSTSTSKATNTGNVSDKTLPQTGEQDSVKLVVVGFVLLAASIVLGFKKVQK